MIESLHLINCQSHKDTLIEFSPGLNVFVGDTDSGKSAIIRGLDKVIYNNTPSKELISHWGGPMSIITSVDGNSITLKNDKKDSYILNKTILNAIGTKVPDEISSIFNMGDVNIQNQSDYFFLLMETSGYVASYLNKIANLGQIDSTTKSIKSELNGVNRSIEHDKKSLKEKEESLESYSFLPKLKTSIKETDKLKEQILTIQLEIDSIKYLIDKIKAIDSKLSKIEKLLSLKFTINDTLEFIAAKKSLEFQEQNLNLYITRLEDIDLKILNKLTYINLRPVINDFNKIKSERDILSTKLDILTTSIKKISTINKKIKIVNSNRIKEHNTYHAELKKLNKCFFCGSKLN